VQNANHQNSSATPSIALTTVSRGVLATALNYNSSGTLTWTGGATSDSDQTSTAGGEQWSASNNNTSAGTTTITTTTSGFSGAWAIFGVSF
jgi:hypothetical protein